MLGCLQTDPLYEILGWWLLMAGVIGFMVMGIDKSRAIGGAWRIPEATLLLVSLAGGSLGVAVGGVVFHHKTSKLSFLALFLPILAVWLISLQAAGFLDCLGSYLPL
jgi:uncharacterized membrane protein YsdA (DUF1294 family)